MRAVNAADLLAANGIRLDSTAPGEHYAVCPRCSAQRQLHHQKLKCLSVEIDAKDVCWHCHNCSWSGPEKGSGGNGQAGDFAATYDYRDPDGVLQFQKVKYPPGHQPRFRIRRPDGHGGWAWGAGKANTKLLYRIDEVIEAIAVGRTILPVEGEKDADRLWSIGIPATTSAHGAQDVINNPNAKPKWYREHSEQLRGADIVVLNDNDPPGYAHADATCRTSMGIVARVRRLDLKPHWPECPKGGDISDWLDAGHSREDLDALIAAAPDYQPKSPPPPPPKDEVQLVWECMADIEPEAVDWIWPGRIARGKLTLIAGDPGTGKSQLALDTVARVSKKGAQFPDGSSALTGSALILTAEDAANDTVRPRLEAAGADLARVHRLKAAIFGNGERRTFDLQHDLVALSKKLAEVGDVALVIIDPITSYMGSKIDSHRTTDVRAVLEPLAAWAEEHHVAVIGITHPPKNAPAKAIHALVGSIAYVAAARMVFLTIEEPGTERRLMLAVKNNLGPLAPGLGYALAQTIISKGIVASHVIWDSAPVTMTANEALGASAEDGRAMTEAKDFLLEELADGPRPAKDLKKAAQAVGLSWGTVRRAQARLNITSHKTGLEAGWEWRLPEHAHVRPEDAQA
jgi:putative DNA primase/helicase